jgi:LPS-assembly protein
MAEEALPDVVDKESSVTSATTSPEIDQQAPVTIAADSLEYNSEEDLYEAEGDVILRQDGVELKAEKVLWQAATQDAAAQGSVQLSDAGTEVSGERLQYNMSTGQGQIRDGRIFIREGNFHLGGEQIEKHGQAEYFVRQGSFTTCDGEVPDWKFSSSEVDVTLGGYARARNVWFHVKDIPVLYTPYIAFPVKTERESGLLTPSFGYSNNKGALVSLAWYQVIDRNMDATVSLDYLSEVGLGKGLEYRYALADQNNGEAFYYHVTGTGETPDLKMPDETEDIPDLYYLRWEHRGKLPGNWRLMADIEYTDNKLFFEEFGEVAEDYNRDKTVSTLMLGRNWQKLNLVGHARYIKDLETDNDATLQRLPELSLGLARYRLGDTPFYAGLESYATRFSRDEGEDGERLYLKPSLSAVFTPGSWLEIVPQISLYERLYTVDDRDDEMFVPEFSLGLATRLVKNFDVDSWGIERLQHSVEPKVTYTYTPDEFQDDLPLFDLHDRIEALNRNAISYALANRLTARSTASDGSSAYRDVLNLRLSQSYDIDEDRNNRSGENQPFSPVRVELDFWPTSKISMDLDSQVAVYGDTGLQSLTIGSSARDDIGNAVMVNYSYKDENFAGVATDFVQLQLDTPILKPIYTRFEERYDFRENRELEKVLGLEYRSQCWSLLFTYRNRYREDQEDDQEFMISFVLAGLGQDKGFGSRF